MKFTQFDLDERLVNALQEEGIEIATDIQSKAIVPILKKQNVLGLAPTGTGKTFAYLVPSLHHLLNAKIEHNDPYIVILVPTRELAKQAYRFVKVFKKHVEISVKIASTGVSELKDKSEFTDIIIATPGNLHKLAENGDINLENISILIIDEIDRMVDQHFFEETNGLLEFFPHRNQRQTLLFGSTLPQTVEPLVRQLQRNSTLIDAGRSTSPSTIHHQIYETERDAKYDLLKQILETERIDSVIIFTRSQSSARITTKNLLRDGLDVEEIHGGLTQRQRTQAITNFSSGQVAAIVATDIAARGIDIPELSHVISFDVPRKFDDYLHRSGRTGRINAKGTSIIIASPDEFEHLEGIKRRLNPKLVTIKKKLPRPENERKFASKPQRSNYGYQRKGKSTKYDNRLRRPKYSKTKSKRR